MLGSFHDGSQGSELPDTQATENPQQPPSREHSILLGPFGLRAGWSIVLYFVAYSLIAAGLSFGLAILPGLMHALGVGTNPGHVPHHSTTPAQPLPKELHISEALSSEALQAAAVLLATLIMARLERRPFAAYGLPRPQIGRFLGGAVIGLAALGLLAGALRALHLLVFDRRLLEFPAALRYGGEWLVVFALVGLFEEFFFRGYIQFTLMRGLLTLGQRLSPANSQQAAFWIAAVCWSLAFLAVHLGNQGETASGLCAAFVAGMVFCYALWRTGSLWWGIGFHMTWDWSESFLYGVPDSGILSAHRLLASHPVGNPLLSGGAAGPEGSLLVLPVLLLVVLVLRLWPATPLRGIAAGASSDIVSAHPIP